LRTQVVRGSTTRTTIFDKIGAARDPAKATSRSEAAASVISGFEKLGQVNGTFIDLLRNEPLYAEKVDNLASTTPSSQRSPLPGSASANRRNRL
jgi:hypothetical protein